ncbi:MAG: hypothetical protein ACLR84_02330, partial [Clostridia bacterium]
RDILTVQEVIRRYEKIYAFFLPKTALPASHFYQFSAKYPPLFLLLVGFLLLLTGFSLLLVGFSLLLTGFFLLLISFSFPLTGFLYLLAAISLTASSAWRISASLV